MLALIYLVVLFILGDSICRRFFSFVSIPHRFAAAFLTGLLISSWWTYLSALLFYWTSTPLIWGNLLFFVTAIAFIYWLRMRPPNDVLLSGYDRTDTEFKKWDWIAFALVFLLSCYLMFTTFGMKDGNMLIGIHQSSDFGSTVSIMQSFARGHNFPTEFTHFSGERIRYHFLFYFQAGNLEFLGFSPAFANNILAVISMASMLILVMTLGALVFGSRVIGRIAAALFFFFGTLSFYTFFSQLNWDWSAIINKIATSPDFIPSGYEYRGETWGVWSLVNYANQRHLASSIGLFLLVLTFLIIRYRRAEALSAERRAAQKALEAERREEQARIAAEQDRLAAERAEQARIEAETRAMEQPSEYPETVESWQSGSFGGDPPPNTTDPFAAEAQEKPVFADPQHSDDMTSDSEDILELDEPLPDSEASKSTDLGDREKFIARGTLSGSDDDPETEGPETRPDDRPDGDGGVSDEQTQGEELPADEPVDNAAESFQDDIQPETPAKIIKPRKSAGEWLGEGTEGITSFIFAGILLGLMPMWNGAIFVSAFAILALLFVLFPQRRQMVALGIAAAIFAVPQVIFLKTGGMPDPGYSLIGWGYTLTPRATVMQVVEYVGWIFGFKWLLIVIALIIGTSFQRRLFLAFCSLIILTFCFQFSIEVMTNHKFLNLWVVLTNLYTAAALVSIWNFRILGQAILSRIVAIVLTILITLSGMLDLYPFHTTGWGEVAYGNDPLVKWVDENTDPKSVFLSWRYTSHGILLAGRKLFYGHPYYAWGAGYDTTKRDRLYVRMFESTNPAEVFDLLKENGIDYVAIDNGLRKSNDAIKKLNESIFEAYFDVVFEDTQNKYGKLTIYKVPDELGEPKPEVQLPPEEPRAPINPNEAVPAFMGGEGNSPGKFVKPRGIAVDDKGNFYVADTGNNRIQKFDSEGKFVSIIGDPGEREGKIKEPNGVAIDAEGNLYVADAGNHKFLKYNSDGTFAEEYNGPDTGFYGPRDLVIGPNNQIYIVDQGRTRVARFQPTSKNFSFIWGVSGSGEGEFRDATGIGTGDNLIFVADLGNGRIQVFDLEGKFVRQWPIPSWQRSSSEFPDVIFDQETRTVYVTSGSTNEVLAFDENGAPKQGFNPQDAQKLENPSSMAILTANKKRWLLVVNSGGNRISKFELGPAIEAESNDKTAKTDKKDKTDKSTK